VSGGISQDKARVPECRLGCGTDRCSAAMVKRVSLRARRCMSEHTRYWVTSEEVDFKYGFRIWEIQAGKVRLVISKSATD